MGPRDRFEFLPDSNDHCTETYTALYSPNGSQLGIWKYTLSLTYHGMFYWHATPYNTQHCDAHALFARFFNIWKDTICVSMNEKLG